MNQPLNDIPSRRGFMQGGMAATLGAVAALATSMQARAQGTPGCARPLEGKVAFVTGAARGIGRAIAETYARAGATVAMLDVADPAALKTARGYRVANMAEFDAAVARVRELGGRPLKLVADVRDLAALRSAAQRTVQEFGGLDIVVANAGYVCWHTTESGSEAEWVDVVDVNVHGVWKTMNATIPHLKKRGGGSIITLASIGGRAGFVGNGAYTATKWAVIGLTKQAALELGPANIAVNAISPGPVDTPMYRSEGQIASMGMKTAADQDQALNGVLPLGDKPALKPEDIARTALFLASEGARSISGTAIDVALGFNANYTA
jgi:NAD(P)-dependent dehydrogenase (short-subunit alcohol dehydrogenase family)